MDLELVKQPELLPIIGVIGSHETALASDLGKAAGEIGCWIAGAGCHLLTGGGPGIMAAAAAGFCSVDRRRGLSIGILPAGKPLLYPNRWVELPICTHLTGSDPRATESRNHINVRTSLALVALPGSKGTLAELELALARPRPPGVIAYLPGGALIGGLSADAVKTKGAASAQDVAQIFSFLEARLVAARKTPPPWRQDTG